MTRPQKNASTPDFGCMTAPMMSVGQAEAESRVGLGTTCFPVPGYRRAANTIADRDKAIG